VEAHVSQLSRGMQMQEQARKAAEDKLVLQHKEAIAAHESGKLSAATSKNDLELVQAELKEVLAAPMQDEDSANRLRAAEAKNVKESQHHASAVPRQGQKVEKAASALKTFKEKQ
jgi:hypothetical protein